jgi:hypothetical protein
MTISFSCECGQQLQAKEEHAGRRTRCPKCGSDVMIPSIEPAPEPEPPPRPEAVTRRPRPDVRHPDEDDDWAERRPRRPRTPERTSTAAIISLVLGILSLLCTLMTGIPAIIAGIIGLSAISRSGGRLGGKGMAITGIILGTLGTVCIPLLVIPGAQKVRLAAARVQSQNNLKQLALGMQNFHEQTGQFPPAVVYDRDGKPLYSWRVLLLPYVEQDALYREFHLNEPWDSPHNKALLPRMPKVYAQAAVPADQSVTFYQVFDGPGAIFDSDKSKGLKPFFPPGLGAFGGPGPAAAPQAAAPALMQSVSSRRLTDITDGTSNTIVIVEAGDPVPWTKPVDLRWDPNGPLPKLGGLFNGRFDAALADGSVRFIDPRYTSEKTIRAAITANGGEILGRDW